MEVLQKLNFIFFVTCLQCLFSFLDLLVEMECARQLSILDWNDKVTDIDYLEAIHPSIPKTPHLALASILSNCIASTRLGHDKPSMCSPNPYEGCPGELPLRHTE